ncbi:hypothetical protein B0H19DRAFT_1270483 [Mycena capillaripes]|nr:hypothetical protein B0H19DRAFT_1270483 [Mycena capillaripes]
MAYDDGFVWTPELVNLSNQLWAITAMVGAALCAVVLIVIGIVALSPAARPHLDRVSFRILMCTLAANTVFGITNAIGGKFTGSTWMCVDVYNLTKKLTLEISSFLLFCVAFNLQLVVIHGINGQKMEKYYIGGSILISLCLTVPPYAMKQYGWDPLVEDCWYSNDDPKQRLAWQIGTQLFWTLLTVAGEIFCAIAVVIFMVRHQAQVSRLQASTGSQTRSRANSIVLNDWEPVVHVNVYRGVIIRIILYPTASALINLTSVACVIHATVEDGVKNWTDYRVLLLSDFVYGGRAVLYALLAATDPSLVRAVRAWMKSRGLLSATSSFPGTSNKRFLGSSSRNGAHAPLSVYIECSMVHQADNGSVMVIGSEYPGADEESPNEKYSSVLKPRTDIEAAPKERELPDLLAGEGWVQDDAARRARSLRAREQQREAFQKQI